MNIRDLFKVMYGHKRSEILQFAEVLAIRILNPSTVSKSSSLFSLGLACYQTVWVKIMSLCPLTLHNFDIKTFLIPCYHIIYFTCSCVHRMCEMTSGNSQHEINPIRFLITKV